MKEFRICVGDTDRTLEIPWQDENGDPLNVSGASFVLKATCADVTPGLTINVAGIISGDPLQGRSQWQQIGGTTYIALVSLGEQSEISFEAEGKMTSSAGKVRHSDRFLLTYYKPLID